ncbi:MAG: exosortase/archaeosortase family protein [Luteolibacter sp.]
MENAQTSFATDTEAKAEKPKPSFPITLIAGGLTLAIVVWFFGFEPSFGFDKSLSLFGWLMSAWNDETGLEHGVCMPIMVLGLICYRFKELLGAVRDGQCSYLGLFAVFFGALLYVISHRLSFPRTSALGLPLLLWGGCHYLWGWKVAKIMFFPLIFLWFAIPLSPSINHQVMTPLQLWVVSLAHHFCSLCGVETKVVGTIIFPVSGDWLPIHMGGGCSNLIYALMPLLMITAGWAYVAKISMWQKAVLFLSALPLAIIGNALRVTSILVIAENGDARWATTTWYDWSRFLIVYPLLVFVLLVLHSIFLRRLPWKKAPQIV